MAPAQAASPEPAASGIRLVLSDVDGTLVTSEKQLTAASVEAVAALHAAGISFAITSGRPPLGMAMLVGPLQITTQIAAFNGGMFVDSQMNVLSERTIPEDAVGPTLELLESRGLDVWLYRGPKWLVRDADAPHVERETATVGFGPTVVSDFADVLEAAGRGEARLAKIVGVSDDHALVENVEREARELVGDHASASRSQPYYLDVTNPLANKGEVVDHLRAELGLDAAQVCTLGDMPNDVLMFSRSGLSIAMGNAGREVQRAARHVTGSNDEDGFASAIEQYVLAPARR